MNAHQGELPATKADVEEVAVGLHTELVRVEHKVDALEKKVGEGFEDVLEELRGMRDEMKVGRRASRLDNAELSQRMDMLEQEVKKVKERVGMI